MAAVKRCLLKAGAFGDLPTAVVILDTYIRTCARPSNQFPNSIRTAMMVSKVFRHRIFFPSAGFDKTHPNTSTLTALCVWLTV